MKRLPEILDLLRPDLDKMNGIILDTLKSDLPLMDEICRYYLERKGKQIRPVIVLLGAHMFGGVNDVVLKAAASLELLHNATLIHDDVVDETPLRRGRRTVNAIWDNQVAVLAGDFFVSNALAVGISTRNVDVVSALSDLGKELSLGEIQQICHVRDRLYTEEGYMSMISKKTASLFRNCVKLGAETSGASAEEFGRLVDYAEIMGLCFQIRDDIFDYYDSEVIGKPTGNDLREGKVTLPLIYALQKAPAAEAEAINALLNRDALDDAEIAEIVAFTKKYGGIEMAEEKMRAMQKEAERLLDSYPDTEWKEAFRSTFNYIIERDR